eukprot:comp91193_c0_seq1/m.48548 comp91193_c0_seq1/g.48548  ORF comp91193_c0_seq1/g.48548 comp91193_c0_seq1/m.48548 type:complete len:187 (-) comp91193_c0_seq1:18-578(-)
MGRKVLLGLTGSVASIKAPKIVDELVSRGIDRADIQVVSTESAKHFYDPTAIGVTVHSDRNEWETWQKMGDPVLHIELRNWADILIIAPLDANTLAKLAAGLCDNLLTCIVRAWDLSKPLLVAPAMNTHMWNHPHTARHVSVLTDLGYSTIQPIAKTLACGDTGVGAMAEPQTIADAVVRALGGAQ